MFWVDTLFMVDHVSTCEKGGSCEIELCSLFKRNLRHVTSAHGMGSDEAAATQRSKCDVSDDVLSRLHVEPLFAHYRPIRY